MKINQAFAILSDAANPHVARIITEHNGAMSRFAVWRAARALRRGAPVAKIIHEKWFFGMPFYTDMHTLDPRPDTETVVESVLRDWGGAKDVHVLDLGTGTGCILISIVRNIAGAGGVGIDISRGARRVAQKNVKKFGLSPQIKISRGTFCHMRVSGEQFDIIVSNPPYIAHGDTRVNAGAMFDPKIALYAQNSGLAAYEQIAENAQAVLKQSGRLYLEIGVGMSRAVRATMARMGWKFVRADKDLGGKIRVLVFSL